jgi:hypothetical protein
VLIDDVALDFALELSQDVRFQQIANHPEQIAIASITAGCLQSARESIDLPEEQWVKFLQSLKNELPYGLRSVFRKAMNPVVKQLPRTPSTGRNEILDSPQKRKQACDLVSNYERMGDSKRVAYQKVARDMNCSARTIQRAWKSRAKKKGQL